ncbi:hypothetical protein DPMN_013791 [Dreissena polymorpha]|uniref:Uncharacterized protein n=1 Tax=Dreissena polymorpha TaxID=45954 RepID=A0A9D4N9L5_DREPO|nr:hypothetical protein DPMN_013791 [Dreissena polymorpha]
MKELLKHPLNDVSSFGGEAAQIFWFGFFGVLCTGRSVVSAGSFCALNHSCTQGGRQILWKTLPMRLLAALSLLAWLPLLLRWLRGPPRLLLLRLRRL